MTTTSNKDDMNTSIINSKAKYAARFNADAQTIRDKS